MQLDLVVLIYLCLIYYQPLTTVTTLFYHNTFYIFIHNRKIYVQSVGFCTKNLRPTMCHVVYFIGGHKYRNSLNPCKTNWDLNNA